MERIHTKKRREGKTSTKQKGKKPGAKPTGQSLVRTYNAMRSQFQESEITYQCHLFIRRIANSAPPPFVPASILPLLYEVAKSFLLNELQVAHWSLYLTRIVWQQPQDKVETSLHIAALSTKQYYEDEFFVFEAAMRLKLPDFEEMWRQWTTSYADLFDVSPTDLRARFQELSDIPSERVREEAVDYNQLIFAILQMSPPLMPSQFDEEMMKQYAGPPVLSLGDDRRSGATAPSCSESEVVPEKDEYAECLESQQDEEAFPFWGVGSMLPRISSLTEIWPDLSTTKSSDVRKP